MSQSSGSSVLDDLAVIADTIDLIDQKLSIIKSQASSSAAENVEALEKAKRHYRSRRQRDLLFENPNLFGEPAWDMLVDLFIATEEGKKISVSSLCVAAAVPMTTALRWITILENEGLVTRTADAGDARRYFLSLSADAYAKVKTHFVQMRV